MRKEVTITCFDISSDSEHLTYEDNFYGEIKSILEKSESVSDRIRYLSDGEEDGEFQFISNFKVFDEGVFCTFLHLENGRGINISEKLMKSKSFDLEDAENDPDLDIRGHLKDSTYLFMTKEYIVLKNCRGISYDDVSLYLNYLLENYSSVYKGKQHPLFIRFHIKKNFDVSQIKSFEIDGGYRFNEESLVETVSKKFDLSNILGASGIKDLNPDEVISASVVFKIRRTKKTDAEENKKITQTLFNAFNTDNVSFRGKNNTPIDINHVKLTKSFSLKFDDKSKQPDKDALRAQMLELIKEV